MTTAASAAVRATVLCLLCACAAAAAPVPFTTIHRGTGSQLETASQITVRTAVEWKALWNKHAPGSPIPPVDFARFMVVGVFLGTRPTGGYSVEITGVDDKDGHLVVSYREQSPGPSDMVSQALTSPVHLIRVPMHKGKVSFTPAPR